MNKRLCNVVLPALVAGAVWLPPAHADVFTWTDANGRVNVSNMDPPDGVRVTSVTHVNAPKVSASADAAMKEMLRDAEVQALAERVRQLQGDVEAARRQPPPTVVVAPVITPPSYAGEWSAPPPSYSYAPQPAAYGYAPGIGCDPSWGNTYGNCGYGFYPGGYTTLVVVRPNHRRPFFSGHGVRPVVPSPVVGVPPPPPQNPGPAPGPGPGRGRGRM